MIHLTIALIALQLFQWPAEVFPPYKQCPPHSWSISDPIPSPTQDFQDLLKWHGWSAGVSWTGAVPPNVMVNIRVAWSGKASDGGYWLHASGCNIGEAQAAMRPMLEKWYGSKLTQPQRTKDGVLYTTN